MEFVIVSGSSGAGKSRAIDAMEDIGFYCVDNMPPMLIPKFAELCRTSRTDMPRVAVVVDARGGDLLRDLAGALEELQRLEVSYKILFLECDATVLARRYKETRRKHPLCDRTDGSVARAIAEEREMLRTVRERTDYLIDTTHLSSAQLRERIVALFLGDSRMGMPVQCMSFGFKYGYPGEADMVMDVRCFKNPFYVEELRPKTGLDKEVYDYVMNTDGAEEFAKKLCDMVDFLIPRYAAEGKSQLVIAIGCTGGKHRSVTFAQLLAEHLQERGQRVLINHRDIGKS